MALVPVPGKPGRVADTETGEVSEQSFQYHGSYYDAVEFTTFAAGTKKDVFKTQDNKELQHTNLTQTKRIKSSEKLKMLRFAIHVRQWAGTERPSAEDVVFLYEGANVKFLLGSTNLVVEGPLFHFPSGLGITGPSTANNFSTLHNGVPSMAAAPRWTQQPDINDEVDLNCQIRTDAQTWLSTDSGQPTIEGNIGGAGTHILVEADLYGVITRPLGG